MGHQRLGKLPRTRSWLEVVALIQNGASADQVAHATILAAEIDLRKAARAAGLVETVWLLCQLPFTARATDFERSLLDCGLAVPNEPGVLDLTSAFSAAVDARLHNNRGRTENSSTSWGDGHRRRGQSTSPCASTRHAG